MKDSAAAAVENAQQEPQDPWFFGRVTAQYCPQLKLSGAARTRISSLLADADALRNIYPLNNGGLLNSKLQHSYVGAPTLIYR